MAQGSAIFQAGWKQHSQGQWPGKARGAHWVGLQVHVAAMQPWTACYVRKTDPIQFSQCCWVQLNAGLCDHTRCSDQNVQILLCNFWQSQFLTKVSNIIMTHCRTFPWWNTWCFVEAFPLQSDFWICISKCLSGHTYPPTPCTLHVMAQHLGTGVGLLAFASQLFRLPCSLEEPTSLWHALVFSSMK